MREMVSRQNRNVVGDNDYFVPMMEVGARGRVMILLCRRKFRAFNDSGLCCPYFDNWFRRRRGLGSHPFLPADRLTGNESSTSGRRQCQNGGLHRLHRFCTEPLSFHGTHAAAIPSFVPPPPRRRFRFSPKAFSSKRPAPLHYRLLDHHDPTASAEASSVCLWTHPSKA